MLTAYALKEWAIAVDALTAGETIMLLRKGGIREDQGRFRVDQTQVLLYPTYEHQDPDLLKVPYGSGVQTVASGWHPTSIKIAAWAEITDVLPVWDGQIIANLADFHIWNQRFVCDRLKWKPKQALYVLLLRVYLLEATNEIPYHTQYGGCKSWIELQQKIDISRNYPAIADQDYGDLVTQIRTITGN